MKAILHLGNYKTASSAIQGWLYRNRDKLCDYGIYYGCCDEPPICAHGRFTYSILGQVLREKGLYEEYGKHPLFTLIAQSPDEMWQQMLKEAEKNHCGQILISHEAMFCEAFRTLNGLRHVPPEELCEEIRFAFHENLYRLISEEVEKLEVIVYLRRQDEYLESQYNQYCKMPWFEEEIRIPDFAEFYALSPVTLDYRKPLNLVREIYGAEHVQVKAYPYETSPYEEFGENILGLSENERASLPLPESCMENRSLCHDAIEFKRLTIKPELAQNQELVRVLEKYSSLHPDNEKYTYFTRGLYEEIEENYMRHNQEIAKLHLPVSANSVGKVSYPGLSPDKMMEIAEFLTQEIGM